MVTLRPMGKRAVLAEVADLSAVVALHAALAAHVPRGVEELVPAARTVLVAFDPARITPAALAGWIHAASEVTADAAPPGPLVEVPVRYDGADLEDTAALLGVSADRLVAQHAATEWTVAFTGFAPGFAYLVSDGWTWDIPRLAAPRTRVPAGSVAVAGEFSGAYPRETPGGWRLLGTTDAVLFDPDAATPALLPPRSRVRFVPERAHVRAAGPGLRAPSAEATPARAPEVVEETARLAVLAPGGFTTVQDLGRSGRGALGVARSGALDRVALRVANRLVGNDEAAAGLEIALGGFRARAEADTWVCVTGALVELSVDGRARDLYAPVRIPAGGELAITAPRAGLRSYLALRGGIMAPSALGSRAGDVLAGLGPAPVRAGDVLRGGSAASAIPVLDVFPWSVPPALVEVGVADGPRADWFAAGALSAFLDTEWEVSPHADRVGIRFDGPPLERVRHDELPSEGMRPGAIQVPPHGRPVVLLADGPVTGGYPVIAVVDDDALDALGQARPGDRVRFRRV